MDVLGVVFRAACAFGRQPPGPLPTYEKMIDRRFQALLTFALGFRELLSEAGLVPRGRVSLEDDLRRSNRAFASWEASVLAPALEQGELFFHSGQGLSPSEWNERFDDFDRTRLGRLSALWSAVVQKRGYFNEKGCAVALRTGVARAVGREPSDAELPRGNHPDRGP